MPIELGVQTPPGGHGCDHAVLSLLFLWDHAHDIHGVLHGRHALVLPRRSLGPDPIGLIHPGHFVEGPIVTTDGGAAPEAPRSFGPPHAAPEIAAGFIVIAGQDSIRHGLADDGANFGPRLDIVTLPNLCPFRQLLF